MRTFFDRVLSLCGRIVRRADRALEQLSGGDHFLQWIFWAVAIVLILASAFFLRGPVLAIGGAALLAVGWIVAAAIVLVILLGGFLAGRFVVRRHQPEAQAVPETATAPARKPSSPTGRKYDDFQWGDPPPTRKQFGYAMSLGAAVSNNMSKEDVSDCIADALGEPRRTRPKRSTDPASPEQLAMIAEWHGVLPRPITREEADEITELLSDYELKCPFCGENIFAWMDDCFMCQKSLKKLRIPIDLPDKK